MSTLTGTYKRTTIRRMTIVPWYCDTTGCNKTAAYWVKADGQETAACTGHTQDAIDAAKVPPAAAQTIEFARTDTGDQEFVTLGGDTPEYWLGQVSRYPEMFDVFELPNGDTVYAEKDCQSSDTDYCSVTIVPAPEPASTTTEKDKVWSGTHSRFNYCHAYDERGARCNRRIRPRENGRYIMTRAEIRTIASSFTFCPKCVDIIGSDLTTTGEAQYPRHHFASSYSRDLNVGTDKPQDWQPHCRTCDKPRPAGNHFGV